jgi:ribosomal protein L11
VLFFLFVVIRLVVPAALARPGPPLSPVLGQHAVKVADFVAEFNRVTAGFTPGVPVVTRVTKLPGNKFVLRVTGPTAYSLLRGARRNPPGLYDVVRVTGSVTPARARTVLGTLRSTRWVPE